MALEDFGIPPPTPGASAFDRLGIPPPPPAEPGIADRFGQGVRNALDAQRAALTNDPAEIAGIIANQRKRALPQTEAGRAMAEEIKPYQEEYQKSSGAGAIIPFASMAAKRLGQFATNPKEFTGMMAENLPNQVPGIVGMLGGAKTGALAGGVVAGPPGALAGSIIGGVAGGTAAQYGVEQGSEMIQKATERAQAAGVDINDQAALTNFIRENYPTLLKETRLKGIGTAGTDAILNRATLGMAGAGTRAIAKQADDLTAAVKTGAITAEEAAPKLAAIQAADAARNTVGAKVVRGAGITGAEMAGEGLSEAAGQKLGYGEVNALDVIDEGLLGAGQGVAMAAGSNIINRAMGAGSQSDAEAALQRAAAIIAPPDIASATTADEAIAAFTKATIGERTALPNPNPSTRTPGGGTSAFSRSGLARPEVVAAGEGFSDIGRQIAQQEAADAAVVREAERAAEEARRSAAFAGLTPEDRAQAANAATAPVSSPLPDSAPIMKTVAEAQKSLPDNRPGIIKTAEAAVAESRRALTGTSQAPVLGKPIEEFTPNQLQMLAKSESPVVRETAANELVKRGVEVNATPTPPKGGIPQEGGAGEATAQTPAQEATQQPVAEESKPKMGLIERRRVALREGRITAEESREISAHMREGRTDEAEAILDAAEAEPVSRGTSQEMSRQEIDEATRLSAGDRPSAGVVRKLNAAQQAEAGRAAATIARALGKKIVWHEDLRADRIDPKTGERVKIEGKLETSDPNTIHLSSSTERSVLAVFGHELLHSLRRQNGLVYNRLVKRIQALMQDPNGQYRKWIANNRRGMSDEQINDLTQEELIADFMGEFMVQPEFWIDVFKGQSKSWVERMVGAVRDALQKIEAVFDRSMKIKGKNKAFGAQTYIKQGKENIDQVRKALADAFNEWSKGAGSAQPSSGNSIFESSASRPGDVSDAISALRDRALVIREKLHRLGYAASHRNGEILFRPENNSAVEAKVGDATAFAAVTPYEARVLLLQLQALADKYAALQRESTRQMVESVPETARAEQPRILRSGGVEFTRSAYVDNVWVNAARDLAITDTGGRYSLSYIESGGNVVPAGPSLGVRDISELDSYVRAQVNAGSVRIEEIIRQLRDAGVEIVTAGMGERTGASVRLNGGDWAEFSAQEAVRIQTQLTDPRVRTLVAEAWAGVDNRRNSALNQPAAPSAAPQYSMTSPPPGWTSLRENGITSVANATDYRNATLAITLEGGVENRGFSAWRRENGLWSDSAPFNTFMQAFDSLGEAARTPATPAPRVTPTPRAATPAPTSSSNAREILLNINAENATMAEELGIKVLSTPSGESSFRVGPFKRGDNGKFSPLTYSQRNELPSDVIERIRSISRLWDEYSQREPRYQPQFLRASRLPRLAQSRDQLAGIGYVWHRLARFPRIFKFGGSTDKKSVEGIARDFRIAGVTVKDQEGGPFDTTDFGSHAEFEIHIRGMGNGAVHVRDNFVNFTTTNFNRGSGGGSLFYPIALAWAHNNNLVSESASFLLAPNTYRRTEQSFSAALRAKTTRNFTPYESDDGGQQGLHGWHYGAYNSAEDRENLGRLAARSMESMFYFLGDALEGIAFDPTKNRIVGRDGNVIDQDGLKKLVDHDSMPLAAMAGIGESTLRRNLITAYVQKRFNEGASVAAIENEIARGSGMKPGEDPLGAMTKILYSEIGRPSPEAEYLMAMEEIENAEYLKDQAKKMEVSEPTEDEANAMLQKLGGKEGGESADFAPFSSGPIRWEFDPKKEVWNPSQGDILIFDRGNGYVLRTEDGVAFGTYATIGEAAERATDIFQMGEVDPTPKTYDARNRFERIKDDPDVKVKPTVREEEYRADSLKGRTEEGDEKPLTQPVEKRYKADVRQAIAEVWSVIADTPKAMKFGKRSQKKGLSAIAQDMGFRDVIKEIEVKDGRGIDVGPSDGDLSKNPEINVRNNAIYVWLNGENDKGGTPVALIEFKNPGVVELNTMNIGEGGYGAQFYQMVANWAVNNGIKIKAASTILDVNTFRRTEQMMSAMLRLGNSEKLAPNVIDQRMPGYKTNVGGWRDENENLALTILTAYDNTKHFVGKQLERYAFDPENKAITRDGVPIPKETLKRELMKEAGTGDARIAGIGESTIRRYLITDYALKALDKGKSLDDVIESIGAGSEDVGAVDSVLYSEAKRPGQELSRLSLRYLSQRNRTMGPSPTRQTQAADDRQFAEFLRAALNEENRKDMTFPIPVQQSPAVLRILGAPNQMVAMGVNIADKIAGWKHAKDFTKVEPEQLSELMRRPIMVFRGRGPREYDLFLDALNADGNPVMIAVKADTKIGDAADAPRATVVLSAYSKKWGGAGDSVASRLQTKDRRADLLYLDKDKAPQLLRDGKAQFLVRGVQEAGQERRIPNWFTVVKFNHDNAPSNAEAPMYSEFTRPVNIENAQFKEWFKGSKVHEKITNRPPRTPGKKDAFRPTPLPVYFSMDDPGNQFAWFQRNPRRTDAKPSYLRIQRPIIVHNDVEARRAMRQLDKQEYEEHDGVIWMKDGEIHKALISYEGQVKAPRTIAGVSRKVLESMAFRPIANQAKMALHDLITTNKVFGWWDRTVGTQYNKAQKNDDFGDVYNSVQDYINDISDNANQAANLAPDLLPRLDRVTDAFKSKYRKADLNKIAAPIFEGTLTDERVYTDQELRTRFGLNDKQVGMYKEFRHAVDESLRLMNASNIHRLTSGEGIDAERVHIKENPRRAFEIARDALAAQEQALRALGSADRADAKKELIAQLKEQDDKIKQLMDEGYAPLMRFGRYTVYVYNDTGRVTAGGNPIKDEVYFGMFESEREANKMARLMRETNPGSKVEQGVNSEMSFSLFKGVTPDTLEVFADAVGASDKQMFQKYLKHAINNRSALKRLMRRKGMEGFDTDAARVLSSFIVSNARTAAKNYHFADMMKAAAKISNRQGDVKDEAIRLVQYVQEPKEEAQFLRGLLFVNYLGGSIASALVNMTQPFMMTAPWLQQFGSKNAGRAMAHGLAVASGKKPANASLAQALALAESEGIVSPQEIHNLYAESIRGMGSGHTTRRILRVWGGLFSAAEQWNRRATFVAAWDVAEKMGQAELTRRGYKDSFDFAVKAIAETQGTYNKGNRPNWARGPIGSTLFTFKQYSIAYLEWWKRLPTEQKVLAFAVLALAAGLEGLPFSDDLADVVDTMAESLGYNFQSKKAMRQKAAQILGKGGGDFLMHGMSSLLPLDVSGRLGLGNLIPGTGILKRSNQDKGREITEVFGPAGSLISSGRQAFENAQEGRYKDAMKEFAPVAIKNALKGLDMWQTGAYKDAKGRKVVDVDKADALWKTIGFQPSDVATATRKYVETKVGLDLVRDVEQGIAEKIARSIIEKDPEARAKARQELTDWNAKNPESRIVIKDTQILRRVREMNKSREDRTIKRAPPELRGQVRNELRG